MKNVSTIKSDDQSKCESPKTPGGISKSLLTPCRRVGLSRKWRNAGPSPFVSPVATPDSQNSTPVLKKTSSTSSRKRSLEEVTNNENVCESNLDNSTTSSPKTVGDILSTPKAVQLPKKKKSKRLIPSTEDPCDDQLPLTDVIIKQSIENEQVTTQDVINVGAKQLPVESDKVTKPEKKKSKSDKSPQKKSPNNLAKECFVLVQRKLLPKDIPKDSEEVIATGITKQDKEKVSVVSQALFDSDSDDAPLSMVKKQKSVIVPTSKIDNEDDDFIVGNKTEIKIKKLQDKQTSITSIKSKHTEIKVTKLLDKQTSIGGLKTKDKQKHEKHVGIQAAPSSTASQIPDDEDDDFDFSNKRTILIRKTYDKTVKPAKAKSTGSITQKDIDDIKARIEFKKNLLLSKALTEDTAELRQLIKKWRKGCQDALVELMELMRSKFPDRQNMEYSEILRSLRIPPELVGYDSDNDLFVSPDDSNIILSKFK